MIRQTITKGPIEGQKRKWTDRPMFDLTTSVLEVNEAARVFLQEADRLKRYTSLPDTDPLHISKECFIRSCLSEVWRAGRKYQRNEEKKEAEAV